MKLNLGLKLPALICFLAILIDLHSTSAKSVISVEGGSKSGMKEGALAANFEDELKERFFLRPMWDYFTGCKPTQLLWGGPTYYIPLGCNMFSNRNVFTETSSTTTTAMTESTTATTTTTTTTKAPNAA